jgi:hypothetical protein
VPGDVPPDRGEAEDEGHHHGRAEHQPEAPEQLTIAGGVGIEQGHPQARKPGGKSARDQQPPGGPVPAGPPAAETGNELEQAHVGA